jgi:transcriptional regulator with XRE-family HTH domain
MTPQEFKAWRERMGWSQAQTAAALEIDLRNIQRREAGEVKIGRETALACIMLEKGQFEKAESNVVYDALFDSFAQAKDAQAVRPRGRPRKSAPQAG